MVEQKPDTVIQAPEKPKPAASDDAKAKVEAAEAAQLEAHPNKGQFVLYLGPRNAAAAAAAGEYEKRSPQVGEGTVAEITAAQWTQAGVDSTRGHRWDLANNWLIPATQFSEAQLDYLFTYSRRFELVDADGQKVDR